MTQNDVNHPALCFPRRATGWPDQHELRRRLYAIPWRDLPLDDALAAARAEDRRGLVLFVAQFAPASQTLERVTLGDGRVGPLILARTVELATCARPTMRRGVIFVACDRPDLPASECA